jgi:hypothetical protein
VDRQAVSCAYPSTPTALRTARSSRVSCLVFAISAITSC